MKVRELIKKLQEYDPNSRVLIRGEKDPFSAESYICVESRPVKRRVNMEFSFLLPPMANSDREHAVVIG